MESYAIELPSQCFCVFRTPPFVAQVLVGPRTDGKILGGEISTCLMESSQQDWNAAEKQEQLNNETYIDPLHQCFWKVI